MLKTVILSSPPVHALEREQTQISLTHSESSDAADATAPIQHDAFARVSRLPYSFAEHAWALRYLRKEGVNPTNSTILEAIGKRRDALKSGLELESAPAGATPIALRVTRPAVDSLAEPYDQLAEKGIFEREIIRQEEFLADAREWNHYLLARVDSLVNEIRELRQCSMSYEQDPEKNSNFVGEFESSLAESSPIDRGIALSPEDIHSELQKRWQESEEKRLLLEQELEDLKHGNAPAQTLEKEIEEQRLALEFLSKRAESLTRQLEEAGQLKLRAEQLNAELMEARSSLESYRQRESALRANLCEQEALRSRADAELQRLVNALQQQQVELSHARSESEDFSGIIERERSRLHAEQTRSAAMIAQLTRQLEEERSLRQQQGKEHESKIEQLCFEFEQERQEFECAQKESAETIARLQQQIEELQQIVATARHAARQAADLKAAETQIQDFEMRAASSNKQLEQSREELRAAHIALKESEARAADAHKALEELRVESEARISRLEATIAHLEQALEQRIAQFSSDDMSVSNGEIDALRRELRIQTETAEQHKSAIAVLQRKLQETENELVELRSHRDAQKTRFPINNVVLADPQNGASKSKEEIPMVSGSPSIKGHLMPVVFAFFLAAVAGIFGVRYSTEIQSHLLPAATGVDQESDKISTPTQTSPEPSIITTAVPSPASIPSSTSVPSLPADQSVSIPPSQTQAPPVSEKKPPSTEWNLVNSYLPVFTDGFIHPYDEVDLQGLPHILQKSPLGVAAFRGLHSEFSSIHGGFEMNLAIREIAFEIGEEHMPAPSNSVLPPSDISTTNSESQQTTSQESSNYLMATPIFGPPPPSEFVEPQPELLLFVPGEVVGDH